MNQGLSPSKLADELTRQLTTKKDYKAPVRFLEVEPAPAAGDFTLRLDTVGEFGITPKAHEQLADRLGIHRTYYKKMLVEARTRPAVAALLAGNVNVWLQERDDRFLLRTLDGNARAFLSDRYRVLDNYDLAEAVLPALAQAGAELVSTDVNENRMFLKAVHHSVKIQVKVGDVVEAGISIRNDEVGEGSAAVEPFIFRLACLNGMRVPAANLRKFHVGRGGRDVENPYEFFKDDTLRADDRAFFLKVRDTIAASFTEERFAVLALQLQGAAQQKIERKPEQLLEVVTRRFALTEAEGGGVLANLINDAGQAGYTRWGLANAVTALANDAVTYDRSSELEKIGGEIITLADGEWEEVAA